MLGRVRGMAAFRTVAVAVIAFLIGSASVVIATGGIPGSDGRIQGCYNEVNGNLRVVTTPLDCRSGEASISWSQTGPLGLTGPTGATGATGAQGATGATGPSGAAGPTGAVGAIGATGATGATGSAGATGPSGANGAIGPSGATGPTGAKGDPGANVAPGTNGSQGPSGAPGPTFGSLAQLNGVPCTHNGVAGAVTVSDSTSGQVVLTCVVTPALTYLALSIPSFAGVGIAVTLTATAQDQFHNTLASYNAACAYTAAITLTPVGCASFVNGVSTTSVAFGTTGTTTVTVSTGGLSATTGTITVLDAVDLPVISSFTASPSNFSIDGGVTTLSATFTGGTGVITGTDGSDFSITSGVSVGVGVDFTTTFTLTVTNILGQSVTAQRTVHVSTTCPPQGCL